MVRTASSVKPSSRSAALCRRVISSGMPGGGAMGIGGETGKVDLDVDSVGRRTLVGGDGLEPPTLSV